MLSVYLLIIAVVLIAPVALRWAEEHPDNTVVHNQDAAADSEPGEDDPGLLAAA